jgi:hypothetical protein
VEPEHDQRSGPDETWNGLSTGRFANATGHFELGGQVDFNTYSFVFPGRGPSHLSARTKSRKDPAPDPRIATSILFVAMRWMAKKFLRPPRP